MRTVLNSLLVVALAFSASLAAADEKSHHQAAIDLLATMNTEKLMQAAVDQTLESQIQANPAMATYRKVMKSFLEKYMGWEGVKDELANVYTERFTETELNEIKAFYATPTGKKLIEKLPEITVKGMQMGRARVEAHRDELIQMLQAASPTKDAP